MALFLDWPSVLPEAEAMFALAPTVRFGPVLPNGWRQREAGSPGGWVAEMKFEIGEDLDTLREYMAAQTMAQGGVTEFFVLNKLGRILAPWPAGTGPQTGAAAVGLAGGRALAGGRSLVRQVIDIRAQAAAAEGATAMTVKLVKAGTLAKGQDFTVIDRSGRKRMHRIVDIPAAAGTSGGLPLKSIKILPPLRGPVAAGVRLDFDRPSVTMTFDATDTGRATMRNYLQSSPSVVWRESFNGLQ